MDKLNGIDRLAREAAREPTPLFDVAGNVMSRIRDERRESVSLVPFDIIAAVSSAAALVILVLIINFWLYITSPLMELFPSLQEVALW